MIQISKPDMTDDEKKTEFDVGNNEFFVFDLTA